jgi:hypothetical protein
MLTRRVAMMFGVLRCRGLLLGHVASLDEVQAYVQVFAAGYTEVRTYEGRAKQGRLHSVAELVECSRAGTKTRQTSSRVWCLVRHTSLTHAGARQSRMALILFHSLSLTSPRRVFRNCFITHSISTLFPLRASILQSSFHHPARIPATNLYTRRDNTAYTEQTFLSCRPTVHPFEASSIPAVPQPTTFNVSHAAYQGRSFFWPQLSWAQRLPPSFRRSSEQTLWRHGKNASEDSGLEQMRCEIRTV